jgi:hypothetical protein
MATEKQIIANRNNSKLGGPKTAAGKIRSSKNSLKHGILSNTAVLPNEDSRELEQLVTEVVENLQPHGSIQEYRVQRIIDDRWNLRRINRAENEFLMTSKYNLEYWDKISNQRWEAMERYRIAVERRLDRNINEYHKEKDRELLAAKLENVTEQLYKKAGGSQGKCQPVRHNTSQINNTNVLMSHDEELSGTRPDFEVLTNPNSPPDQRTSRNTQPEIGPNHNSRHPKSPVKSSEPKNSVKTGGTLVLDTFLGKQEESGNGIQVLREVIDNQSDNGPAGKKSPVNPTVRPNDANTVPTTHFLGIEDTFNPCA